MKYNRRYQILSATELLIVSVNKKRKDTVHMRSYKDYEKHSIGSSDIAALTFTGIKPLIGLAAEMIKFGSDGNYTAYFVDENAVIGPHYQKIATFSHWLKIYDDSELVRTLRHDGLINVFRAGEFGCIIQCTRSPDADPNNIQSATFYSKLTGES